MPKVVEYQPQSDKNKNEDKRISVIVSSALTIQDNINIIRFRGRAMIEMQYDSPTGPFTQFAPLIKDNFEALAYPLLGGVSRSRMSDVFAYVVNTAPDLTHHEHLIAFGTGDDCMVWNSRTLGFDYDTPIDEVVWRSPYAPSKSTDPNPFVLSLSEDEAHYYDLMQSMAPLLMFTKPDGVIWWVGSGANGKSSLMDALYRIFPNQLASLTVKRLTDERDTPFLNGMLANIVKESSEGRIDDTQIYKSIGTHEDFRVHRFHSQDSLIINGNMHHIFSANTIPTFNDKGYSARRRTHIIPFKRVFESDPYFNERTFTPQMLSHLVVEIMRAAVKLQEQQNRYKFSAITTAAKLEYDAEANNAEDYAKELIEDGIVAFDSFAPLKMDYENWCARNGYTPLGLRNLRLATTSYGFDRASVRVSGESKKLYLLKTVSDHNALIPMGMGRSGMYSLPGFAIPAPVQQTLEGDDDPLGEW